VVYKPIPRSEIIDALVHIRDLHRRIKPRNDRDLRAKERREAATRYLLSNLPRTNDHPTLNTLLEIADICSLTVEGAHRLFGYNLRGIREYDLRLNGGRTHIKCPHERLRSGKVHRSLRMSDGCEDGRDKGWKQNAQDAHSSLV
jgi:hypothetical protein